MPSGRNEAGGRSPSGRATRPTDQAPAGLGDTASVPNAAWTPAPWGVEHCEATGAHFVVAGGYPLGETICETSEANANLISAAPALYAALVRLGTLVAAKYGPADDEVWTAITQGIVATARARGEVS